MSFTQRGAPAIHGWDGGGVVDLAGGPDAYAARRKAVGIARLRELHDVVRT